MRSVEFHNELPHTLDVVPDCLQRPLTRFLSAQQVFIVGARLGKGLAAKLFRDFISPLPVLGVLQAQNTLSVTGRPVATSVKINKAGLLLVALNATSNKRQLFLRLLKVQEQLTGRRIEKCFPPNETPVGRDRGNTLRQPLSLIGKVSRQIQAAKGP
ncbi:MAG: hypothetical protein ACUVR8_03990 [Acidobacteriota bacterium]